MIALLREKAQKKCAEIGELSTKQEGFQYIPSSCLKLPNLATPTQTGSIDPYLLEDFANRLVFIDGYFCPELSRIPKDIVCLPLDAAFQSYGLFLQNRWTKTLQEETDPLALLNAQHHGKGAFVYIPPNAKARLHILQLQTGEQLASPRLEITLGKQAHLSLVHTEIQEHPLACSNAAFDLSLDAGAKVRWIHTQKLPAQGRAFSSLRATLKRDARFEALSFTEGAASVRNRYSVQLSEENSSVSLQGLSMLTDNRQAHVHAFVEHAAPHCESRQHFKSALAGQSQASFEGKIFVRPIAQKTMAYQLNNNLILSDQARSNSKPNLEIFADDVKASHGSTVTQLSVEELFYLRSRGLPKEEARSLLTHGFCKELIDALEIDSLRQPLYDGMKNILRGF